MRRLGSSVWLTKDDKEPPKGFEKFFKKGETEKKEASADKKAEEKKKEEEAAAQSEEEDATEKKKEEEKKSQTEGPFGSIKSFYFDPNGSPKFENWLIAIMLSGFMYYYLTSKAGSSEITYMDFVN